MELIRSPKCHVITTVRVKEKFEYGTDDKGKSALISMGEQQIQQADLKFEPDLVIHMLKPGKNKNGTVTYPKGKIIKSRYVIFDEGEEYEFTPELLEQLRVYLAEGEDPDVLLEKQRLEYVKAVKDHLDKTPSAKPIWDVLKKDAGHENTKLNDLPLEVVKQLYIKLTS